MGKNIQAIRGMKDILPKEAEFWHYLESTLFDVAKSYGYSEIRFPILESTELFSRAIGEVTDIVEKEMYTFLDRNGDSLTLRPEGTASCVRAGIEHGLLFNQIQRFFYFGPMFRHERPQKGRYRQFHQFGVEAFGLSGPDIDAEVLAMSAQFWQRLGIADKVSLEINTLGDAKTRDKYRELLRDYFRANLAQLDQDSLHRLEFNPLRILDSKNPALAALIKGAPKIIDCLDGEPKAHFLELCDILDNLKIKYQVNPCLVRGLDYYCLTVFEWVTSELGAQGAVCAGGHYDGLVAELGGKSTPAIGFAMGIERLAELAQSKATALTKPKIYLALLGKNATKFGFALAENLRSDLPNFCFITNCGGGALSAQLKRADKSEAVLAIIIGDSELAKNQATVKYMRKGVSDTQVNFAELVTYLKNFGANYA
ncbi:MAG: histidine--tRNA ligase [Gammaproteobacteria bacterium]|nr:histidine--tRNA ligase [Gammaproteobacteria bacterium]